MHPISLPRLPRPSASLDEKRLLRTARSCCLTPDLDSGLHTAVHLCAILAWVPGFSAEIAWVGFTSEQAECVFQQEEVFPHSLAWHGMARSAQHKQAPALHAVYNVAVLAQFTA